MSTLTKITSATELPISIFTDAEYERMAKIFSNILSERKRQQVKWGDQSGNLNVVWSTILTEEVGEAAKAVLQLDFEHGDTREELRNELIQVAAVAVAWVEALDKNAD